MALPTPLLIFDSPDVLGNAESRRCRGHFSFVDWREVDAFEAGDKHSDGNGTIEGDEHHRPC
ncbi:hypothetical protein AWC12_20510 [Mycolicibacterium iranicum]|uniref:Uncharacterized protein n=1 Tax=Mycolicibacterium iranicum TaxID=912594 RepID=A0A1X1WFY0_MYCIR|nr:hypothetical protein AWC12_20510 [Mycolicibacterium iranicum]